MTSPTRRVIPPGYMVHSLRLDGTTPLLMSSADVDRDGDTYRAYKTLSKKRGKTVEDEARIRELEFYTRLYYDAAAGVFVPGKNVKELLRSAATKWRKGEEVKRSLIIPEYRIPLGYEGPREPEKLWAEGFSYTTMVANAGAGSGRVERTRPCFEQWAIETEIAFDPEDLDEHEVQEFVVRSQKYGLGDYRPDFGSFRASLTFVRQERADSAADAAKPVDERARSANTTRANAMMT